jgi:nucleotide-binding universal stress UspA family protein
MLPLRKILCPTDFSEPSYKALEAANELALHFSAALTLVYVVPLVIDIPTSVDFYIPSDIQTAQARAEKALGEVVEKRISEKVRIRTQVVIGDPGDEIVKTAADVNTDIIVIATHGLTGWRRLIFGSVAEKVVRLAQCPVLTIQSPPKEG